MRKIKCEIESNMCMFDKLDDKWLNTAVPRDVTTPMFTYEQDTDPDGVLGLFHFDHGQSYSQ